MNNIINVYNQLRKQYYPAASENAEDRRRKRRKKENKRKFKKRKEEILVRNSQTLASLITGSAAEDRFSDPSKIRKTELTALNKKTLTPRKHYEPLKYLLENDFFLEYARECILSILSVLEVRKVQTKASAKHEKSSKTPKNFLTGQKTLFDILQAKKSEDEKVVEESDNLKNVTLLHDSSEKSCGDDSACSDSGGSESDCKD